MSNPDVRYVHVHGHQITHGLDFSNWFQAHKLGRHAKKNVHQGGFTIRVERNSIISGPRMTVSICSFDDRYVKSLGRMAADAHAERSFHASDTIVVPAAHGETKWLVNFAVRECLQLWLKLGFSLDRFSVGVLAARGKDAQTQTSG